MYIDKFWSLKRALIILDSLAAETAYLDINPANTIVIGSIFEYEIGAIPCNKETFISSDYRWCTIDISSSSLKRTLDDANALVECSVLQF